MVVALSVSLAFTPAAHAATSVAGTISADATWTAAESPYTLTDDVYARAR